MDALCQLHYSLKTAWYHFWAIFQNFFKQLCINWMSQIFTNFNLFVLVGKIKYIESFLWENTRKNRNFLVQAIFKAVPALKTGIGTLKQHILHFDLVETWG